MRTIFLTAGAVFACANVALASTYHVSTTGTDGGAGTETDPWRTIQHAADRVAPGDTVIIHAGTYTGFQVGAHGTQAAPIAFTGNGDVRIDGASTGDQDAVHIEGASWVRIEGLTITGARRAGVSAIDCDHITVANNKVDQNGKWGVFSGFCDDFTVEHNEVSRAGTQHGIYASNSADRPVIRGNTIWGNAMCGVHINGDITEGGDGVISDAIVEDNVIRDNGALGGSAINGDGITGALIRNNVLDGNHASGISLYQIDGGAPSTGNRVINNTIRMAANARWAVNIQDGSSGNVLRNNIMLDAAPGRGAIDICPACLAGFVSDHNAVVGQFIVDGTVIDLPAWRTRTGTDAASFVAGDADLFANPAAGDLSLRAGSPAIDHGMPDDAPATDVIGTARPQGAAIDIGAYESCNGTCTSGGGSGSGAGGAGSGSGAGSGEGGGGGSGSSGDGGGVTGTTTTDGGGGGCAATDPGTSALVLLALVGLVARRRR